MLKLFSKPEVGLVALPWMCYSLSEFEFWTPGLVLQATSSSTSGGDTDSIAPGSPWLVHLIFIQSMNLRNRSNERFCSSAFLFASEETFPEPEFRDCSCITFHLEFHLLSPLAEGDRYTQRSNGIVKQDSFSVVPLPVSACTVKVCKLLGNRCACIASVCVHWVLQYTHRPGAGTGVSATRWGNSMEFGAMAAKISACSRAASMGRVVRKPSPACTSFVSSSCPWDGAAQLTRSTLIVLTGLLTLPCTLSDSFRDLMLKIWVLVSIALTKENPTPKADQK